MPKMDKEISQEISNEELNVVVRSRSKTYFQGKAKVVSSNNDTGVFDVLPEHANFITLVDKFVVVTLARGDEQKFDIDKGVMRVLENKVDIYLTV